MSFESLADRDYALEAGRVRTDCAWVLSDRDVWYPNPFYVGLRVPHPEDDSAHDYVSEHGIDAWRDLTAPKTIPPLEEWEIPF